MASNERGVRRITVSAEIFFAFGIERGVPAEVLLRGTGLTATFAETEDDSVELEQELQLARNLREALGRDDALGLEVGTRVHLTSGIWGFGMLGCRTVGHALEFGLPYLEVAGLMTRVHLEVEGEEARLVVDDAHLPEDLQFFLLNRDGAAVVNFRRQLVPFASLSRRVSIRHAAPPNADVYRRFFGADIEFGAPRTLSVFDARFLDMPLPQASERTVAVCEAQCRKLVARRKPPVGLAGRVRETLLEHPANFLDMEALASALGMTSRTLRRRLLEERTTYREIVDKLRLSLAEELLSPAGVSIPEVAERLGYAEVSSFRHAFKRLTGKTPAQFAEESRSRPRRESA